MSSTYINSDPEAGEEDTKVPLKGECSYSNRVPDGKAQLNCNYKSPKPNKNGNLSSRSDDDGLGDDTEGTTVAPSGGTGTTDIGFRSILPPGPIIELRGREVVFALLVFLFLSVSIGLILVLASNKLKEAREGKKGGAGGRGGELCQTEHCLRTALSMMEMMDLSADPCTDFWQYACGGYVAKHEIPPARKTWSVDSKIELAMEANVRKILESPVAKGDDESSAEWKFKTMYNRCMDTDQIDELGARPLLEIIDRVGGWAVLEDWNIGQKSGLWDFQIFLRQLNFDYLTPTFFRSYVSPDDKASHRDTLQFDLGGLSTDLPLSYYLGNSSHPMAVAYRQYMRSIARSLGASPARIEVFINQTYQFEVELAKLHSSDEGPMVGDANYNVLTIEELQKLCPRINWRRYVDYKYSEYFSKRNATVIVSNPKYMSNVSDLIRRTDTKVLNYYMVWRFIDDVAAKLLSAPFREARETFMQKIKGTQSSKVRWRVCMDVVNEWFKMAVSAIFIKTHFDEEGKKDIESMVIYIRRSFDQRMAASEWMDNATRLTAREKLEAMTVDIGFPDFLLKENEVDDFYSTFQMSEADSFFQMDINGVKHNMQRTINRLTGIPVKYETWAMNPIEVNAFFSPMENKMAFPVGLLQSPHYSPKAPEYINFGAIGTTIGHEMTHGFDSTGYMFDKDGNMAMWWTPHVMEKFHNKTKCVADYYSTLEIKGIKLNGESTLGENIADIGGVIQSYLGYEEWVKENGEDWKMPGLKMNDKQAFFLAFAQNFCIKRRYTNIRKDLQENMHAPGELRVKGTLSQVKMFSDAYKCKAGSPMNPVKKCTVW